MMFRCVLRLVGGSKASCSGGFGFIMSEPNFEERVFSSMAKKLYSTALNNNKISQLNGNMENIDAEYEEAIKALNSLQSNAAALRHSIAMNNNKQVSLDQTVKYLNRSGLQLEDIEKLSVIHVSGTKGKGSTCALTESILRAHGVKTGFYSSPHLVSVTERIRINGVPISKQKFTHAFWRVFNRLQKSSEHVADMPAYFKFLTILCLHIFLEEAVDVSILEVGIGGLLDCTNIIRNTKTVGITSLGLEHTELLGHTLQEIASQKAGIIKPNSNVYTSVTQPECLEVIKECVQKNNATLYNVPAFENYFQDPKTHVLYESLNNVIKLNGSLAIQLANDWLSQSKNKLYKNNGISTTQLTEPVIEGLVNCNWPGRCQKVQYFNMNVHLDGAHTVESMLVCQSWFKTTTTDSQNPKILIFNTTGDRDSKKLLNILRMNNRFSFVCFVPNIASGKWNKGDTITRAYTSSDQIKRAEMHATNWKSLCEKANEANNSKVFTSVLDSFEFIRTQFGVQKVDILVTGSLHLIGATVLALNEFKATRE